MTTPTRSGFTIVELLIVVVVIAILASITIVSFNGISARATRAQVASDISNIKKTMAIHTATYNTYPLNRDTALSALGLNSMSARIFAPTQAAGDVGSNYCANASMTRTKYCLVIYDTSYHLLWWDSATSLWQWYQITNAVESTQTRGSGNQPTSLVSL